MDPNDPNDPRSLDGEDFEALFAAVDVDDFEPLSESVAHDLDVLRSEDMRHLVDQVRSGRDPATLHEQPGYAEWADALTLAQLGRAAAGLVAFLQRTLAEATLRPQEFDEDDDERPLTCLQIVNTSQGPEIRVDLLPDSILARREQSDGSLYYRTDDVARHLALVCEVDHRHARFAWQVLAFAVREQLAIFPGLSLRGEGESVTVEPDGFATESTLTDASAESPPTNLLLWRRPAGAAAMAMEDSSAPSNRGYGQTVAAAAICLVFGASSGYLLGESHSPSKNELVGVGGTGPTKPPGEDLVNDGGADTGTQFAALDPDAIRVKLDPNWPRVMLTAREIGLEGGIGSVFDGEMGGEMVSVAAARAKQQLWLHGASVNPDVVRELEDSLNAGVKVSVCMADPDGERFSANAELAGVSVEQLHQASERTLSELGKLDAGLAPEARGRLQLRYDDRLFDASEYFVDPASDSAMLLRGDYQWAMDNPSSLGMLVSAGTPAFSASRERAESRCSSEPVDIESLAAALNR